MLRGRHFVANRAEKPDWLKDLGLLGVITSEILGFTGAGVALGYLAATRLGWPRWVLPIFAMIGLTLAFYRIYRATKLRGR
jgi:hypothetical protein